MSDWRNKNDQDLTALDVADMRAVAMAVGGPSYLAEQEQDVSAVLRDHGMNGPEGIEPATAARVAVALMRDAWSFGWSAGFAFADQVEISTVAGQRFAQVLDELWSLLDDSQIEQLEPATAWVAKVNHERYHHHGA